MSFLPVFFQVEGNSSFCIFIISTVIREFVSEIIKFIDFLYFHIIFVRLLFNVLSFTLFSVVIGNLITEYFETTLSCNASDTQSFRICSYVDSILYCSSNPVRDVNNSVHPRLGERLLFYLFSLLAVQYIYIYKYIFQDYSRTHVRYATIIFLNFLSSRYKRMLFNVQFLFFPLKTDTYFHCSLII